jgi:NarL family two-component system response regulator LiaR
MDQLTISVLIVDDHVMVRQGIRSFLETEDDIEIVGECGTAVSAIKMVEELLPDVVLMDLLMEGMNGIEATRVIREISPSTKIIVLTSYSQDAHIFPAINAGALSYLLKSVEPDDLIRAIRMASRGESMLHPNVAARVLQEFRESSENENPYEILSQRELEVLKHIAEGMTNAEIGEKLFISEKTVKTHVSNILNKLHIADRTKAAVFAWKKGIAGA